MIAPVTPSLPTPHQPISAQATQPVRILHVVGGMTRGGIETWLLNVLRQIDRQQFQMDFLVHTEQPCPYDDELRDLGSQLLTCPYPGQPRLYAHQFQNLLRQQPTYQVIHSHVHFFSGFVLRLARQAGIPMRIAHSHNHTAVAETGRGWKRQLYLAAMNRWIQRHATLGLGASQLAAADLFGPDWQTDSRWQLQFYGIDFSKFQPPVVPQAVRAEFNIPSDGFVIGHVGRFEPQKNHPFLLEIFTEVLKRQPNAYLLLVGEGPLRPQISQQVNQLGLTERVIFTGSRPDVPRLMQGAMDVFLFPSLYEGLGMVLLEAQAAGLTCIFTDVVPEEADMIPALTRRLSLSQPATLWAEAVLASPAAALSPATAWALATESQFAIHRSVQQLENYYLQQIG